MKHQKSTLIVMALASLMFLINSPLLRADADVVLGAVLLLILCVGPVIVWVHRGMVGTPLFEMFAGMHLIYYWMAFGRSYGRGEAVKDFDSRPIWVVCVFLLSSMAAHYGVTARLRSGTKLRWDWLDIQVGSSASILWAWMMTIAAVGFEFAVQTGLIWQFLPWSIYRPVQTILSAFAMLGVFRLAIELPSGTMRRLHRILFLVALTTLAALHTVSGYLGSASTIVLVAGFGYMLGARRVPILAFILCLGIGSFLNLGKKEWRRLHWDKGEGVAITTSVHDLISLSWSALNARLAGAEEETAESMIERANLGEVLQRITALTPNPIPYAGGESYAFGLSLVLKPQWLDRERESIHTAMTEASLTYGFFTSLEASSGTNISLGPIAEAWMNGGWIVVAMAGACYGLFYAIGCAAGWGRSFDSLGFLSGVLFFYTLINAMELFAGPMLMAFTRTYPLALAALLILSYSRRLAQSGRSFKLGRMRRVAVPLPQAPPH